MAKIKIIDKGLLNDPRPSKDDISRIKKHFKEVMRPLTKEEQEYAKKVASEDPTKDWQAY